jgi:putative spermidine/putrescine transport system substrate-binding protein
MYDETVNTRESSGINRAELLKRAGGMGALLAGGSLSGLLEAMNATAATRDSVTVTEFCWVGSGQDITPFAVRAAYQKAHPDVKINMLQGTNAETYPKIVTSLQVDPNNPLVNFGFFNSQLMWQGIVDKTWVPLPTAKIPNLKNVLPNFRIKNNMGVFFASSPIGLMYNTQIFKQKGWKPPTSWNDIFNPKYKGKVALWDAPSWAYNGLVAVARIHGGSEKNIEPAMKLYESAAKKGQFQSVYLSNNTAQQLLVSGEAWITPFFFGIMQPWVKQGAPLGYAVPKEGEVGLGLGFAMVRGSSAQQQKVAAEVINAMLAKRIVHQWSEYTYSVPGLKGIVFPPSYKKYPPFHIANIKKQMLLDWTTIAKNNASWTQQWNQRVKANL